MKSILDPSFKYVPSCQTDIRERFKKLDPHPALDVVAVLEQQVSELRLENAHLKMKLNKREKSNV